MYDIRTEGPKRRVVLSFTDVMDQDPATFFSELTGAAKAMRALGESWDLLVDMSGMPVMPQDRARNTEGIYRWCIENNVRKAACVMQSITQKMQVRRVTQNDDKVQYFGDLESAQSWLDD